MSHGQTWSNEEVKSLIKIQSDDHIRQLLVVTHKNTEVFKLLSDRMTAMGFNRSAEQYFVQ